jgi:hypothetical protein
MQKDCLPILKKKLAKRRVIEKLNSQDESGKTALHLAIEKGEFEIVELLLQTYKAHLSKVDIHVKDLQGYTPLHSAAESYEYMLSQQMLIYHRGNERIIMALLQYPGIQTNIPNSRHNTPFHCFCKDFSSPSSITQVNDVLSIMIDLLIRYLNYLYKEEHK